MTAAPLTGRKVFAITASFFGLIIGVNVVLAYQAIRTFPGLEVANGYVASQTFDAERAAQDRLGWTVTVGVKRDLVTLDFAGADGRAVQPKMVSATIGRATEAQDDSIPAMTFAAGRYSAPVSLAPGKWVLRIEAVAEDGTPFRQRVSAFVKE
jgi:nitrogen fixation protein FixH